MFPGSVELPWETLQGTRKVRLPFLQVPTSRVFPTPVAVLPCSQLVALGCISPLQALAVLDSQSGGLRSGDLQKQDRYPHAGLGASTWTVTACLEGCPGLPPQQAWLRSPSLHPRILSVPEW